MSITHAAWLAEESPGDYHICLVITVFERRRTAADTMKCGSLRVDFSPSNPRAAVPPAAAAAADVSRRRQSLL